MHAQLSSPDKLRESRARVKLNLQPNGNRRCSILLIIRTFGALQTEGFKAKWMQMLPFLTAPRVDTPLALFADLDTASPQQWHVHPDHLD
jgi:hypothetical protein